MVRVGLVMLLLLAGCSSPEGPTGPDGPAPSPPKDPVKVVVARTGGFAGVMDTITVNGDGSWTHPTAVTVSGTLDVTDQIKLQQLAKDPRLAAEAAATAPPTMCNDAFDYTVTAGTVTVNFTDCPADPVQPVVAKQIVEFVQDAITP